MNFFYTRVSTIAQNDERQFDGFEIDPDCLYQDKISGSKKSRPELDLLLRVIRKGDTVNIWSIDRAARNLQHLLEIIESINNKGATVHFHKEGLLFNGTDNAMHKMQLQILGAVAEFQRSMINEAAAEGRATAKAKGVKFGRPQALSERKQQEVLTEHRQGKSVAALAIDFDVSRHVIYRTIKNAA